MTKKVLDIEKAKEKNINDSSMFTKNGMRYKFNTKYPHGVIFNVARNSERNLTVSQIHYDTIKGISHKPEEPPDEDDGEWKYKIEVYNNAFEPSIKPGELVSLLSSVASDHGYEDILYHKKKGDDDAKFNIVQNGKLTGISKEKVYEAYEPARRDKDIICIYKGSTNNRYNKYVVKHYDKTPNIPIRLIYYFKATKSKDAYMWIVGYFIVCAYDICNIYDKDKEKDRDIYTFYLRYYEK